MVKRVEIVILHVHMDAQTTKHVLSAILRAEHVVVKAPMNVSPVGVMHIGYSQIKQLAVVSVTTVHRVKQMPAHQNVQMDVQLVVPQIAKIVNFVRQIIYFSTLHHHPVLHVLTR